MYNIVSFGIMFEEDIELLLKQKIMFEKYTKEEFKFHIIPGREQFQPNNHSYIKLVETLEKKYQLTCYVPQALKNDSNIGWTSMFTALALEESFKKMPHGKYFYSHLDNFPIKNYSLSNLFGDSSVAGVLQTRQHIKYLWDNCLYIDSTKEEIRNMNFKPCNVEGKSLDCGGESYFTLKNLKENEVRYYPEGGVQLSSKEKIMDLDITQNVKEVLLNNYEIQVEEKNTFGDPHWSEVYINDIFFHYRSLSGWHRKNEKAQEIKNRRKVNLMRI